MQAGIIDVSEHLMRWKLRAEARPLQSQGLSILVGKEEAVQEGGAPIELRSQALLRRRSPGPRSAEPQRQQRLSQSAERLEPGPDLGVPSSVLQPSGPCGDRPTSSC